MSYSKFYSDWKNGLAGGTPMNEAAFDHMEQGITDAHDMIADLAQGDHTHESSDITDATDANVVNMIVKRDAEGGFAATRITGLSTATGNTSAVPKSQLDAALVTKADLSHSHLVAELSDATAFGRSLVQAADSVAAQAILDVDVTGDVDSKIDTALATFLDDEVAPALAQNFVDTSDLLDAGLDFTPHVLIFAVGSIPTRPVTTGTNRHVWWVGPAAANLPTDGTAAGGTAKAAPSDLIFEF